MLLFPTGGNTKNTFVESIRVFKFPLKDPTDELNVDVGKIEGKLGGLENFFFHILEVIIPTDYFFPEELKPPCFYC